MTDVNHERIFCAEQINVPQELPLVLKEFTKEIIRRNPVESEKDVELAKQKIYEWAAEYFRKKANDQSKELKN
ncbi:unnamed protein product [Vitrella brassicaformis CCMP3155]|uniref:Uncharacterized protein n=1 Tax=Vitrella brassicaformis (strain CCMP3155) TaxID=1169540 RepID=A0A0G4F9X9_VITBC|nr:unnamed protein product [Vitrella brassicaformis CCMP3155]|eukprot:CEM09773.1 unnamed protein product [Vitrella brassicaformis CCMP3155]